MEGDGRSLSEDKAISLKFVFRNTEQIEAYRLELFKLALSWDLYLRADIVDAITEAPQNDDGSFEFEIKDSLINCNSTINAILDCFKNARYLPRSYKVVDIENQKNGDKIITFDSKPKPV